MGYITTIYITTTTTTVWERTCVKRLQWGLGFKEGVQPPAPGKAWKEFCSKVLVKVYESHQLQLALLSPSFWPQGQVGRSLFTSNF